MDEIRCDVSDASIDLESHLLQPHPTMETEEKAVESRLVRLDVVIRICFSHSLRSHFLPDGKFLSMRV